MHLVWPLESGRQPQQCNDITGACQVAVGLTDLQRQQIVTEFNTGRSYLRFYFEFKLHHWCQPPWVVYKAAHFDPVISAEGLDECLASDDPHPLIRSLHREPLRSDIARLVDGTELGEPGTEDLRDFLCKLRFAWTAERWVEVAGR